jgi:hypothetical protein
MLKHIRAKLVNWLTERRTVHGLSLSMYIESAPLKTDHLWPKLQAALDLIAAHHPVWIRRMQQMNNSVNIRRIPGTRARLIENHKTILDPYLLADFLPAQVAASIVHEATHARLRWYGVAFRMETLAQEERMCRRAELRFGKRLQAAGIEGAHAVVARAATALAAKDEEVGVAIDWKDLQTLAEVTRIKDARLPNWLKRRVARRRGLLETPQGRAAFGEATE